MRYEIKPYVGVGDIFFDMSPEEVRKTLNSEVKHSKKSSSEIPSDSFEALGIFVDYRSQGICQAVEFAGPASPTFQGQELLGRSYSVVALWVKELDRDVLFNDAGLRSNKFGFGLYAPSAIKMPQLPIKGVIVFDHGYYKEEKSK